ncbi:hypothetical protein SYNPS1DRAFT_18620 [Syncephalis pseudoplumigaleata]|uniref:NADH-ubiquinone oxidoreductase 14 kDa subunit n=1 Tax=Syncephalis pseudoplumigaleata TaxID=1712513 RepID=A0A4P9YU28_9FUNG|nr:hypothetical protein SYNPS1DRAFT_18620 [Syncephalis pseudoplumigaleata]|eukprot:RKP23437.1 hypothetical protein SYNPS1DRAFT_18620 [Syncephalis pseudoplumigaleata]
MVSSVFSYTAGYAAIGVMARILQLGIQRRPLTTDPLWCLVSGAAFGTVGYWLAGVDERNTALLQERKRLLLENRARAEAIYARRQAEQQEASS